MSPKCAHYPDSWQRTPPKDRIVLDRLDFVKEDRYLPKSQQTRDNQETDSLIISLLLLD